MIFVTANNSRVQLELLTQMLVSLFSGSTIYQHTDPLRVPHDVLNQRVDAVFLAAEMEKTDGVALMQLLHQKKPDIPVFILAKSENFCENAIKAGASGCFVCPVCEKELKDAVMSIKSKENVS